jgi:hypothetical protein
VNETSPPAAAAPTAPEDATPRRIVSEDLPLSIAAGVATAIVMSLLDVGAAWALAGVVVSTFVADAIKTELRSRGLSKRRLGVLAVLLLMLDRVKSAFGATPRETPPAQPPSAAAHWALVPVTAVLASAVVVGAFTIADAARGSALIGGGRTSFFGGGHGSSTAPVATTASDTTTTVTTAPTSTTTPTATVVTGTSTGTTTTTGGTTETRPPIVTPVHGRDVLEVVPVDDGAGTITSRPAGIDCGKTCEARFAPGRVVTLVAAPGVGSIFNGWTGCGARATGRPGCTVTVSGHMRIYASFLLGPGVSNLSVAVTAGGRVTSDPKGIDCVDACTAAFPTGSTVTLRASSLQGGAFSGWAGVDCSKPTCTFTLAGFMDVTADFEGP